MKNIGFCGKSMNTTKKNRKINNIKKTNLTFVTTTIKNSRKNNYKKIFKFNEKK